jgi:hypothetical protein
MRWGSPCWVPRREASGPFQPSAASYRTLFSHAAASRDIADATCSERVRVVQETEEEEEGEEEKQSWQTWLPTSARRQLALPCAAVNLAVEGDVAQARMPAGVGALARRPLHPRCFHRRRRQRSLRPARWTSMPPCGSFSALRMPIPACCTTWPLLRLFPSHRISRLVRAWSLFFPPTVFLSRNRRRRFLPLFSRRRRVQCQRLMYQQLLHQQVGPARVVPAVGRPRRVQERAQVRARAPGRVRDLERPSL